MADFWDDVCVCCWEQSASALSVRSLALPPTETRLLHPLSAALFTDFFSAPGFLFQSVFSLPSSLMKGWLIYRFSRQTEEPWMWGEKFEKINWRDFCCVKSKCQRAFCAKVHAVNACFFWLLQSPIFAHSILRWAASLGRGGGKEVLTFTDKMS